MHPLYDFSCLGGGDCEGGGAYIHKSYIIYTDYLYYHYKYILGITYIEHVTLTAYYIIFLFFFKLQKNVKIYEFRYTSPDFRYINRHPDTRKSF